MIDRAVAKLRLRVHTRVANIDYGKRVIESFPYNTSIYYAMYKNHLYLVNSEGNDRETALHGTLVYIVTIYDVITKTTRVLCRTYSCPYCIVYICGEWVIYAEPATYIYIYIYIYIYTQLYLGYNR